MVIRQAAFLKFLQYDSCQLILSGSAGAPGRYMGAGSDTGRPGEKSETELIIPRDLLGSTAAQIPSLRFSSYGLINLSEFSQLGATRLLEFDSELVVYSRRWNGVGSSPTANRQELSEFLSAFGIYFRWSADEYHTRSHITGRSLGLRTFDHLAYSSLSSLSHALIFWSTVADLVQFRGLCGRV